MRTPGKGAGSDFAFGKGIKLLFPSAFSEVGMNDLCPSGLTELGIKFRLIRSMTTLRVLPVGFIVPMRSKRRDR